MPVSAESPAGVQAKLTVNPPGDIYEREADRIAGVMAAHPASGGALPPVQRLRGQPTGQVDVAPASVDQALAGSGRPLEPELRQDMEQRFGYDFSRVRVHTSALAERSARDLTARAYTVGHDIVFGAGGFASGTQEGRRLIAHELTHVVQQTGPDRDVARSVQRQPAPPAEIEMPAGPARLIEPTAELARFTKQPTYIDNNIKKVSFFTAELAIIYYHDGSSLELGLVPRWMKPPVEEVDYHTPREEYRLRYDAKEGISFFRESDLRNVPRSMSWGEVQKRYAQPVTFSVQPGTGRVVPSRVNMLTAPTLCQVLLDSEKKFVEQTQWVAEWGTEVAKVTGGMGTGGFVGSTGSQVTGRIASRAAGRMATTPAARKLATEMDNLLTAGGSKTLKVEGVLFEKVTVSRQGSRLAVRRYRFRRVSEPPVPGHGDQMRKAFEDAAVSVARVNGLKSVTINVGRILNPVWQEWLKSIGYVFNKAEGAWIKTINL